MGPEKISHVRQSLSLVLLLLLTLVLSLAVGLLFDTFAIAATQKNLGEYSAAKDNTISVGCANTSIQKVVISAPPTNNCDGHVKVQSVGIRYITGFVQYYEYPSSGTRIDSRGAALDILPGTRCVQNITVYSTVTGENNPLCRSKHKIRVAYLM